MGLIHRIRNRARRRREEKARRKASEQVSSPNPSKFILEPLEPRLLLSADVAPVAGASNLLDPTSCTAVSDVFNPQPLSTQPPSRDLTPNGSEARFTPENTVPSIGDPIACVPQSLAPESTTPISLQIMPPESVIAAAIDPLVKIPAITGADPAKFQLTGSGNSRSLSFIAAPDFENPTDTGVNKVYDVTVQVSEGSLSDSQAVAVTITDVTENQPPVVDDQSFSVVENSADGAVVSTIVASDSNAGQTLTFSVTGGTEQAALT